MWGDILSTVGDIQYRGRYHDAHGAVRYSGVKNLVLFEYLQGIMISYGTQIAKDGIPTWYSR